MNDIKDALKIGNTMNDSCVATWRKVPNSSKDFIESYFNRSDFLACRRSRGSTELLHTVISSMPEVDWSL